MKTPHQIKYQEMLERELSRKQILKIKLMDNSIEQVQLQDQIISHVRKVKPKS